MRLQHQSVSRWPASISYARHVRRACAEGLAAERHLLAVLREVDDGCSGVRLDARMVEVVHHSHEAGQQARVLRFLEVRAQVCAHLAHCLACRPAHLGMLVPQALHLMHHHLSSLPWH